MSPCVERDHRQWAAINKKWKENWFINETTCILVHISLTQQGKKRMTLLLLLNLKCWINCDKMSPCVGRDHRQQAAMKKRRLVWHATCAWNTYWIFNTITSNTDIRETATTMKSRMLKKLRQKEPLCRNNPYDITWKEIKSGMATVNFIVSCSSSISLCTCILWNPKQVVRCWQHFIYKLENWQAAGTWCHHDLDLRPKNTMVSFFISHLCKKYDVSRLKPFWAIMIRLSIYGWYIHLWMKYQVCRLKTFWAIYCVKTKCGRVCHYNLDICLSTTKSSNLIFFSSVNEVWSHWVENFLTKNFTIVDKICNFWHFDPKIYWSLVSCFCLTLVYKV